VRYIGSDLVLDFVFVPSDKFTCRFVGFALASPLRKGSSFGCEVINVYFTSVVSESCFSLRLRTVKCERNRRLQRFDKTPEALLATGAVVALAVAMRS
jgi:hypothetical protein